MYTAKPVGAGLARDGGGSGERFRGLQKEGRAAVTNPTNAKTAPEGAVSVFYQMSLSDQPANPAC
jgi:hypothetical protein